MYIRIAGIRLQTLDAIQLCQSQLNNSVCPWLLYFTGNVSASFAHQVSISVTKTEINLGE